MVKYRSVMIAKIKIFRTLPQEEAENWARANDLPFLETSAKNDFNVEKIFSKLAVDIYKRLHDGRLARGFLISRYSLDKC